MGGGKPFTRTQRFILPSARLRPRASTPRSQSRRRRTREPGEVARGHSASPPSRQRPPDWWGMVAPLLRRV